MATPVQLRPSGTAPVTDSVLDRIEPLQIVTVARMPPLRFEASLRLLKTLRMMRPRSDDSILVSRSTLVYRVARDNGMKITAKKEAGHLRIWRIA